MHQFRISTRDAYFDLFIESDDLQSDYGDGDFRVITKAVSQGFSCESHCWVAHRELRTFARALLELEASRQGTATLISMSPDELHLKIFSTSTLGHMALSATIGHSFPGRHGDLPHSLTVGFEFDPFELHNLSHHQTIRTLAT